MPPIIHCIRHGQGFHNVLGDYSLRDPALTPVGADQCESLRIASFPDQSNISLVAASPLCRTLQTANLVFRDALTGRGRKCRRPQIVAMPDAQETSDDLCDTGSDPDVLETMVSEKSLPVDLSLVKDGWNDKTLGSRYGPHSDAIKSRARDARIFLRQKIRELAREGDDSVQVVLVTHGSYLHYFTDDWEDSHRFPGTGWHNCESRSYTFESDFMSDDDGDARLTETPASRRVRGKQHRMYGREEQFGLFKLGMQSWEDQGLQRPDALETVLVH